MGWLANISLAVFSISAASIAVEIGLRTFVEPSRLFGVWFVPEINEQRYRWLFAEATSDRTNRWGTFDADLGWDHSQTGVRIPDGVPITRQPDRLRILFFGDSFIHGDGVGARQTIAYQVGNRMPNTESINMGTGGYGIDQSYLKLVKKGLIYKPDIVVFGIHPPNYERASVDFFSGPKPKLRLDGAGELTAVNLPLPVPPPRLGAEILEDLKTESFLVAAATKVVLTKITPIRDAVSRRFMEKMDALVLKILEAARHEANQIGAHFIVLQIPHGNRFKDLATRTRWAEEYPLPQNLIAIYERAKIPYVDLEQAFTEDLDIGHVFERFYNHPTRPDDAGHLSVEGNEAAASILIEALCTDDVLTLSLVSRGHCPAPPE